MVRCGRKQLGLVRSRSAKLACLIDPEDGADLYLMFNADSEQMVFILPQPPRPGPWRLAVDTAAPAPQGCHAAGEERGLASQTSYAVESHASVMLVAC